MYNSQFGSEFKADGTVRRAIALGGGGPAAGLHIGALKCFHDHGIEFDVWSLSCVGVWVGGYYNSFEKDVAPQRTEEHFREFIFQDDKTYDKFPISPGFVPDIQGTVAALQKFILDPKSYENLIVPEAIEKATRLFTKFMSSPEYWNPHAFNELAFAMAAANPVTRYLVSIMWLSEITGLAGGKHPGKGLSASLDIESLYKPDKPFLYHNAWNLREDRIQLFANRKNPPPGILPMTADSMRACSALPFIIETVMVDGVPYCEGALYRTVSFTDLLQEHPDIEEVWVIRIVDPAQVRAPQNLDQAMNNLCMLFAGSLGECNVEEFEEHVKNDPKLRDKVKIRIVPVSHNINYDWTQSNLDRGIEQGYAKTREAIKSYKEETGKSAQARRTVRRTRTQ